MSTRDGALDQVDGTVDTQNGDQTADAPDHRPDPVSGLSATREEGPATREEGPVGHVPMAYHQEPADEHDHHPADLDPDPGADSASAPRAADPTLAGAPAPGRTWSIAEVVDPPAPPDPEIGAERGSRLAVVGMLLIALAALGGFGWMIFAAWRYVTTASDAAQQAHWPQLRGLIEVGTGIVLLVVGTALGSSLQARWTSSARARAARQAQAATTATQAAITNAEAARNNAAAAHAAGTDLARALELLDRARPLLAEIESLAAGRERAGLRLVAAAPVMPAIRESHIAGYRLDRSGEVRLAEVHDEDVDRVVTSLAARAALIGGEIAGWAARRR